MPNIACKVTLLCQGMPPGVPGAQLLRASSESHWQRNDLDIAFKSVSQEPGRKAVCGDPRGKGGWSGQRQGYTVGHEAWLLSRGLEVWSFLQGLQLFNKDILQIIGECYL